MEWKHFSHNHSLAFQQTPHQGFHIRCSGCKSPAAGDVYACWQCNFVLHDQCFRATRSFKHPSHPLHPLTLMPSPTYPSATFFCNSCNLAGDGFSYSCSECEFDIHVQCALTPNPNQLSPSPVPVNPDYNPHQPHYPMCLPIQTSATNYPPQPGTIPSDAKEFPVPNNPLTGSSPAYPPNQHNPPPGYPQPNATPQTSVPPASATATHPPPPPPPQSLVAQEKPFPTNSPESEAHTVIKHFSHSHSLRPTDLEQNDAKVCSACESKLTGSAYTCAESLCDFSLHKACFDLTRELLHKSHPQHPLTLLAAPPYEGFTCDACRNGGKGFVYHCATCSYDLHIGCINWPETVARPDHEHPLTLYCSSPDGLEANYGFGCDVCSNSVDEKAWVYYCRECDFGTHLECVHTEIEQQQNKNGEEESGDLEEQLFKLQQHQKLLDFQMQMAQQNAQFINSWSSSWKIFY